MSKISSADKVQANLQAFKDFAPEVYSQIAGIIDPLSTLVMADGIPSNIKLETAEIYPANAKSWTEGQLKGFWHNPSRLVLTNIFHCNPSGISEGFYAKLVEPFKREPWTDVSPWPLRESAFAFIFGVGLGYHIEELINRLEVSNVFLIEPVAEFLHHSMLVVDWDAVFETAKKRNITIRFVVEADPKAIIRQIETVMVGDDSFFIDGSYIYYHNYSWALLESNNLLMQVLPHHIYSTGFYEDECLMMTQAIANIKKGGFAIAENIPIVENNVPVFIVAAGPSLDNDIEIVKAWRSKVILISCGTTLSILLRHGLRPDLHIEVENGPLTPVHIGRAVDTYGSIKDTILVSSITVHPDASQYFSKVWYYYRPALSSSKVFKGPHVPLYGAEPVVANGGLALALAGGFQEIYLFGVDCGSRVDSQEHHAKDSIYHTDEDFKVRDIEKTHDRIHPGNFGGMFRANYALDMAARGIFELRRHYQRARVYNCSDGVRIDGVQPFSSEAIDLSAYPDAPQKILENLEQCWTHYEKNEGFKHCSRKDVLAGCDQYEQVLRGFFEEARDLDNFHDIMRRYRGLIKENLPACIGVHSVVGPSIECMLRMTSFYWRRYDDAELRRSLLNSAIDSMLPLLEQMTAGAREIFAEIAEV